MQIASVGIDLGKTTFHFVAPGRPRQDRGQVEVLPQTTA